MRAPICPPQNVAPVDQAPVSWVTKMLFGRTWWLFFQGLAAGLANLLNFPLYHDIVMPFVGNLVVSVGPPRPAYPSPPQLRVSPWVFTAQLGTAPTVSSATVEIWRSSDGGIDPGGQMALATFTAGSGIATMTYFDDQNYTVPGSFVYVIVTAIGAGVSGANLTVIGRVQGVS